MAGNGIKVKIRPKDRDKPPDQETRRKLLKELDNINIDINRIIDLRDGWVICTPEVNQAKLTTDNVTKILNNIRVEVALPRAAQAKYTLVFKKLDRTILEHSEAEIKQEFEYRAPCTINKIDEIYKMQQHSIIKVKFNDMETAIKIKKEGIKIFYCTLPPWQIENERTVNLLQCMKCYGYGHATTTCHETVQICSECSSSSHTWKECDARENQKVCTQCRGPHRTFSGLCTVRKAEIKKALEEKARKEEENAIKPYVNVIKQSTSNAVQATQRTFRDALKQNTEHARGETRQIVEATQETLLQKIEEIIDRKLNEMVDKLKTALIQATGEDKSSTSSETENTPKATTSTAWETPIHKRKPEVSAHEWAALHQRKLTRREPPTPLKSNNKGRFTQYATILQESPDDYEDTVERNIMDEDDVEEEMRKQPANKDNTVSPRLLDTAQLDISSDEYEYQADIEEIMSYESPKKAEHSPEHKAEIEKPLSRYSEYDNKEREAESVKEQIKTHYAIEVLIKEDLQTLEDQLKSCIETATGNEEKAIAYKEHLKINPEHDRDEAKKALDVYERFKRNQNEIIKRLKEAISRKTRLKTMSSLPW